MRLIQDNQMHFEFYHSDSKLSKKLDKISYILERDKSFLEKIAEDFKTEKGSKSGAKGMTVEQVIRVAILKQMRNLSYLQLYDELNDNISYRRFTKIHEYKVPKIMALNENIKRLSAESLEELNRVLIKVSKELKVEEGKSIRMDSTGVESNIHPPTDGELLWDCVRVLDRILEDVKESFPVIDFEFSNHTRRAKKRRYKITNTNKKEKRVEAYKDLLKVSAKTAEYTRSCIEQLEQTGEIEATVYKEELEGYLKSLEVIMKQTERRVLHEEKVETKNKLVSIFETHADILAKGKRRVMFGHKILLSGGKSNLILDCVIERGNWSDSEYFSKGIDRLQESHGYVPKEITTDGGFASSSNYDYAVGKGVEKVLFTKKCSSKIVELVKTSQTYKRLKKFRAGIEGCISAAKRSYGLSRCTWKGWASFQSYVWLSVIAYNLSILSNSLLK